MKTPAEIAREYLHRWDRQPITGDLSNRGSLEMHVRAAIEEALHQERAQADARVAAEREACAAFVEWTDLFWGGGDPRTRIAAAIRARGGK